MLKLNETPIRTSENFNINNIKLENVNIPENISMFNNVKILGDTSNVESNSLIYGISKELEKQNANLNIGLELDNEDKQISFKFDKNNLNLVERINIIAKENSNTKVIIKYESEKNIEAYHNGIIDVITHENAKLDIIIVNLTSNTSQNFLCFQNHLKENSKLTYTIIDFGGKNSVTNYYSNLEGNSSQNYINVIYLGCENQLCDLNYITELNGKKTNVNIEVQGVLKDNAKKHFKGTINFKKGCKKAKGNENESCILLSDTAKSLALPMLLCSEEDVEGNHSTSSGKVGNKELFYIMSRGFSLKDARKLLVKAKFNNILENIKDYELKELILKEIDERLD